MTEAKLNIQDEEEEFDDARDDFLFYDCEETFSESLGANDGESISVSDPKASCEDKAVRRRRSLSHRRSYAGEAAEFLGLNPPVSVEKKLKSRERNRRPSSKIAECEKKLGNENSDPVEVSSSLDHSIVTYANNNNIADSLVRDDLNLRENYENHTSLLFASAGIMLKVISFQIDFLVKMCTFPLWLSHYLCVLMFDPFVILKRGREYLIQKIKRNWSFVFANISPFVYEWLKEHKAIWKLVLKCGWGLVWSSYVCAVLVGMLMSAFLIGGLLIRWIVEEPMKMNRILNFNYSEKSPVALVPIIAQENSEIVKSSALRRMPPNHKLQATVSLMLPESDYNQNLGIFQVRVDFLATDGQVLASSRHPCMLQYRSQPIRLLLTFLKVAPILTGYTSETQNLNIIFKGFTEGDIPTACLRVVIVQRAEFIPGAGIPQIYTASLTLESELPLLKKGIWFWKRTLFVWISMTIFLMELAFALICCKPMVVPIIRLREATNTSSLHTAPPPPGPS